jgi:hypothetical protein
MDDKKTIPIYILGQRYEVLASLTILRAFEWAGFRPIRGVGCRGGFCGACGTVYRLPEDHVLHYSLACPSSHSSRRAAHPTTSRIWSRWGKPCWSCTQN